MLMLSVDLVIISISIGCMLPVLLGLVNSESAVGSRLQTGPLASRKAEDVPGRETGGVMWSLERTNMPVNTVPGVWLVTAQFTQISFC